MSHQLDFRQLELQSKNLSIAQRLAEIYQERQPILNQVNEDQQQTQDNADQIQILELAQQIKNKSQLSVENSTYWDIKIDEIKQIIQDHRLRSNELEKLYIINEKKDANFKKKQKVLTNQFQMISSQMQKEQDQEQRNYRNKQIEEKNKKILTKEQKQQLLADKKEAELNQFIQQMTDKYLQFLPKTKENCQSRDTIEQIYNEIFEKYKEDKQVEQLHEQWKTNYEKPKFDSILKADTWKNQTIKKKKRPNTVSHQRNDGYYENLKVELKSIQLVQEEKKIQQQNMKLWMKILYERRKFVYTTLKENQQLIYDNIWKELDLESSGIISYQQLIKFFEEYPIMLEILNLDLQNIKLTFKKYRSKRKGLLNSKEFENFLNTKTIRMSDLDILNQITEKKKKFELVDIKLPPFFYIHSEKKEIDNLSRKQIDLYQQKVQNEKYKQLDKLTQINHDYINQNFSPIKTYKFPETKIIIQSQQLKKNQPDPRFQRFLIEINDLNRNFKNKHYHK